MISVDLSNVWTCVSLPELLGCERELFDAHGRLRSPEPEGADHLGWLNMPLAARERLCAGVSRVAERICAQSQVLVVCGSGSAFRGARGAVELYGSAQWNLLGSGPELLFVGESVSPRQWVELSQLLEDRDFSLHLIAPDSESLSCAVLTRGLRWLLERKYGPEAKNRVSVATAVGSAYHKMAQEEGYELFPTPKELGGTGSVLTAGALVPMAVAGVEPLAFFYGAAACRREMDLRAFENPAWLYAAARAVLYRQGRDRELWCLFDHDLQGLGRWWQSLCWRQECRRGAGPVVQTALLPGDLEALDEMALSGSPVFETMVRMNPIAKRVPVEMDWKDYDGLGFLSGKTFDEVEQRSRAAMIDSHNAAGVPIVDIYIGDLTAESLGELLCFLELTSALTGEVLNAAPMEAGAGRTSGEIRKALE